MKLFLKLTLSLLCLSNLAYSGVISSTTSGGSWSNTSTWVGGVVPVSGDEVTINGNVTVSSNVTCNTLTVNTGKTLTIATGYTLTVSTQTINYGSNATPSYAVSNSGTIILATGGGNKLAISFPQTQSWNVFYNSGTFTCNTGKLSIYSTNYGAKKSNIIANDGTFNANSGTVELSGSANNQNFSGSITFNNVVCDNIKMDFTGATVNGTLRLNNGAFITTSGTYGSNATLEINTSLTLYNDQTWPSGNGTNVAPNIAVTGGNVYIQASDRYIIKTLSVSSGATLTSETSCLLFPNTFSGITNNGTLTLGGIKVLSGATWNINANYTASALMIDNGGIVNGNSYTLTLNYKTNGCFTGIFNVVSGGTFNAGTGKVLFDVPYTANVVAVGTISFNNVQIQGNTLNIQSGSITVNNKLEIATGGDVTGSAGTVNYGSNATLVVSTSYSIPSWKQVPWADGTGSGVPPQVQVTSGGSLTLNNTKTVTTQVVVDSNATLNGAANVTGNVTTCNGTVNGTPSNGTVTVCGSTTVSPTTSVLHISSNMTLTSNVALATNSVLTVDSNATLNTAGFALTNCVTANVYGRIKISNNNGLTGANSALGNPTLNINGNTIIEYNSTSGTQTITPLNYTNLELSGNAAKSFTASTYTVSKNFTVSGTAPTFDNNAVINFNGTAQSIKCPSFKNVTFSNSGDKTLLDTTKISGMVTVSGSANVVSNGFLTLTSNASGTASIGALTGTSKVTGNVNYERYLPAGRLWRFIGWPINGNTFANSWQKTVYVTGQGTGGSMGTTNSNGFDWTSSGAASVYYYNESAAGTMNSRWTTIPNASTSINSAKGYRLFVRGDRAQGIQLLNGSTYTPWPVTLKGTGTINQGDISVSLTCSNGCGTDDGWQMLTNPYPSAIDWNNANWKAARSSNIQAAVYVYNPAMGRYGSWSPLGGSVNGGASNIASGQSFFVQTKGAATLTFKEEYKVNNATVGIFGKTDDDVLRNNLKIRLLDTVKVYDETVLFMHDSATEAFDYQMDAIKPDAGTASISTYSSKDSIRHVFNAIPNLSDGQIDTFTIYMPLSRAEASYQMSFLGMESFSNPTIQFILRDAYTGKSTNLTPGSPLYSFTTASNSNASYSSDRFSLIIITNPSNTSSIQFSYFTGTKHDSTSAELAWATSQELNNEKFEIEKSEDGFNFVKIGEVKGSVKSTSKLTYSLIDYNPAKTVNYYRLKQTDLFDNSIYYKVVSVDFTPAKENNPTTGLETVSANSAKVSLFPVPANEYVSINFNNRNLGAAKVRIVNIMGEVVFETNVALEETDYILPIDLVEFTSGVYFAEIEQSNGKADKIKFVKR